MKEYLGLMNQLLTGQWTADPTGKKGTTLTGDPLPDQMLAGMNPTEIQGMNLELGAVPGQAALGGAGYGSAMNILAGKNLDPASNPALRSYYDAAARGTTNQYMTGIAPSEMAQAASSGAFGGSADAEARALNQFNYGHTLGDLAANIYEPAYQQGQQQITQTMAMLPQIMGGLNVPGETALNVGGLQQQQEQQGLNTQYQNAYQRAMWPYNLLQYAGGGFGGMGSQGGSSMSRGFGMGMPSNKGGQVLGGALGGAGLGQMFSQNGSKMGPGMGAGLGALLPLLMA
jgi:hypothetical protein